MGSVKKWKARKRRKAENTKNIVTFASVLCISLVIVLLLGFQIGDLNKRFIKHSQKIQAVEEQIKEEQKRAELLVQRENYMKSREYIEDVAKEKLGLVYPDEVLLKPAQ